MQAAMELRMRELDRLDKQLSQFVWRLQLDRDMQESLTALLRTRDRLHEELGQIRQQVHQQGTLHALLACLYIAAMS